jgi:hypothetical protein
MKKTTCIALLCSALLLAPGLALAQKKDGDVGVPEDLFAVITLRGKPCGKVKSHERLGENDYLVTCETGHRYRVYVNQDQRVVVEER